MNQSGFHSSWNPTQSKLQAIFRSPTLKEIPSKILDVPKVRWFTNLRALDLSGRIIQIPKNLKSFWGIFLGDSRFRRLERSRVASCHGFGVFDSARKHSSMDQTNMWEELCMCQRLRIQMIFPVSQKVRLLKSMYFCFLLQTKNHPSWWLQAIWNIWVKLGSFPHTSGWAFKKILELPPPGASMCCPYNSW